MPFLHIDEFNRHKIAWYSLVKDHPAQFEVLEWSAPQDRDLIQRSYPDLDTQLFPRSCVSIAACLQKLVNYGGISVRGEDTQPTRGIKILLEDWKSLGPPKKLTVRGFGYPVSVDRSSIMSANAEDPVCKTYRDSVVAMMTTRKWERPMFGDDVAII